MVLRYQRLRFVVPCAVIAALIFALALPAMATAEARLFHWDYMHVDIAVQTDGSAIITEEQQISFEGPYSFVTRVIPLQRLQSITDVAVGDENGWYGEGIDANYRPVSFSGYMPKGQPGRFTVERGGGEVKISWYFTAMNETRTFKIRYRATGLVRMHSGADEIWWAAIGPDRGAEVTQAAATIRLPQRVPQGSLVATAYEDESAVREGTATNDYGATYQYNRTIPEDESWTVRLFFPQGMVAAVPPIPFRHYAPPLFISIAMVLIAVGGLILTVRASRIRLEPLGRNYTQPPANLPPGLVAYLFSPLGSAAGPATLLDLAQRGYITVTRIRVGTSWRARVQYEIEDSGKDRSDLLGYERSLLQRLLEATPFTGTQLQTTLAGVNRDRSLSQEADRYGWFNAPQRQAMRAAPTVIGAIVSVLLGVGLSIWSALVGPEWLIAVTILAGTATMVLAILRPMLAYIQRSEAGARAHQQWGSFIRELRRPNDLIARAPDTALQWLPYAIAGGVAYYWQRALRASQTPAPAWYRSQDGGVPLGNLLMADFARDMFWVGTYSGGAGAGGVGGASGGGGGTAG